MLTKRNQHRIITGTSSLFLDCLRLCAALTVVYGHVTSQWPLNTRLPQGRGNAAHASVVVFFVLSGYVISHTAKSNNRGPKQFAIARLSRLCSVVLPALVITAIVELIVRKADATLTAEFTRGMSLPRYFLTAAFLNEIWFFSAAPPINIPLWSLSFEFWYYAIFGCWFFTTKRGWRGAVFPLIACFVAGPKILLMMPIWLLGCIAYNIPTPSLPIKVSWAIVLFTLLGAGIAVVNLTPFPFEVGLKPFFFANQFGTDLIIGVFIAIALWFLPESQSISVRSNSVSNFRKIADLTFPIYALHFPLIILCRAFITFRINNRPQMWLVLLTVVSLSIILGFFIEKKRTAWKEFFETLFEFRFKGIQRIKTLLKPQAKV